MANPWIKFWNEENVFPAVFLEKNMEIFIAASHQILAYDKDDVILDIGCGPGLLERALLPRVKQIIALDTSANYIAENSARFNAPERLSFLRLGQDYTDLSFLPEATFTKAICLSVVQYYRDVGEIIALIKQTKRVVCTGGKLLIADIPIKTTLLNDLLNLMKTAIKEKMMITTFGFLLRARLGAYHRIQQDQRLLRLTDGDLQRIHDEIDDEIQVLHHRLTMNSNRTHLLITYRS